jgi:hypothetical protein
MLAPGGTGAGKNAAFFHETLFAFLEIFSNQPGHFALFGVTPDALLGIDQVAVDGDLVNAAFRRDEGERFDVVFVLVQQIGRQTGSPRGVVSDRAVFNRNFQQHGSILLSN